MEQLQSLLDYQKIDIQIGKIEGVLKKSQLYKNVVKVRKYLLDSQKVMQKYEVEVAELNTSIKNMNAQFAKTEENISDIEEALGMIDASSSIKETKMLIRKAKEEKDALLKLEKEISKAQKRITDIEDNIHKIAVNVPKYKAEFENLKEQYDLKVAETNEKTAPLKKELKALAKVIGPDIVKKFKGVKKSHPVAVVELDGKRCLGCNMELPSGMAKQIANSNELAECENCGRLLYVNK